MMLRARHGAVLASVLVVGAATACLLPTLSGLAGGDAGASDAQAPVDVQATDAELRCDPAKPFSAPVEVPGLNLAGYSSGSARLSRDELTVYFNATWPGGAGKNDLFVATRATTTDAFGAPTRLTGLNSAAEDWDPTISSDDLTLYFGSLRAPPEVIFVATRKATTDPFLSPTPVPGLNGDAGDFEPWVLGVSRAIYFSSKRPGTVGASDIYRAEGNGAAFGAPARVPSVNSAGEDHLAIVTSDELLMLLGSSRGGGVGGNDVYLSRRVSTAMPFDVPINVTELNSTADDYPSWVSEDGCRVLLLSDRADPKNQHIYEARRPR